MSTTFYAARDQELADRNDEIKSMWDEKNDDGEALYSVPEIATRFGITNARVYQIVYNPYSHLVAT